MYDSREDQEDGEKDVIQDVRMGERGSEGGRAQQKDKDEMDVSFY